MPSFTPTHYQPGTAEKIRVMTERATLGQPIFHPQDARMDEEGRVRVPLISKSHHQVVGYTSHDERDWVRERENDKNPENWYGILVKTD